MSNVLIGIIGVILFIGLALAGALFLGERFTNSKTQSDAARYMSEGSQISRAYELFRLNEGAYPDGDPTVTDGEYAGLNPSSDSDRRRLVQLKQRGYLKSIPNGNLAGGANGAWYIDTDKGAAFSLIGDDSSAKSVCLEARKQAGLTGEPLACGDAAISNNDPCCTKPA